MSLETKFKEYYQLAIDNGSSEEEAERYALESMPVDEPEEYLEG